MKTGRIMLYFVVFRIGSDDTGMKRDEARQLLDRIGVLRHPSDLDMLIFFARHPRSILPSESLAAFLGYDLKDIAESLEMLLSTGLLQRKQTPAHAARMYVFTHDAGGGWLPTLLRLGSTRQGHLALRRSLVRRSPGGVDPVEGGLSAPGKPGPRGLVLTPTPTADRRKRTG